MKAFNFISAVCEIAKIKDTQVACVQTENQFIFIYEME